MAVKSIESSNPELSALQTAAPAGYKKPAYIFIGLLVVYAIVRGVVGAVARPFWFDEFLTLNIISRPSLHDMWAEISRGIDTAPPPFYFVERLALSLPLKKELALRVLSILAFPCTLICVFSYARKCFGDLIACLCAVLLLSTNLFHVYPIEARGYSLMVACIALALVCYQRLPSIRWAALLGVALLLAVSAHYYAVFAFIPFGLAETVLLLGTRRVRWSVWMALGFGCVPVVLFWPLLSAVKRYYGVHVHSLPVSMRLPEYYGAYFSVPDMYGVAVAVVAAAAIFCSWWFREANGSAEDVRNFDLAGKTLLLGLIVLPLILFGIAKVLHAGLLMRYTLPAILGIVLGLGYMLSMVQPKAVAFFALLVLSALGVREMRFWHHAGLDPRERDFATRLPTDFADTQKLIQSAGHFDLPVVFSESFLYPQVEYYCPPDFTKRLVYLTDEARELKYEGTDSVIKANEGFRGLLPMRTVDYTKFISENSEFLVYAEPSNWNVHALLREGNDVQVLKMEGDRRVFLIKMNRVGGQ